MQASQSAVSSRLCLSLLPQSSGPAPQPKTVQIQVCVFHLTAEHVMRRCVNKQMQFIIISSFPITYFNEMIDHVIVLAVNNVAYQCFSSGLLPART